MISSIIGMIASGYLIVYAVLRQREAKKNGSDIDRLKALVDVAEKQWREKGVCPTCHK